MQNTGKNIIKADTFPGENALNFKFRKVTTFKNLEDKLNMIQKYLYIYLMKWKLFVIKHKRKNFYMFRGWLSWVITYLVLKGNWHSKETWFLMSNTGQQRAEVKVRVRRENRFWTLGPSPSPESPTVITGSFQPRPKTKLFLWIECVLLQYLDSFFSLSLQA